MPKTTITIVATPATSEAMPVMRIQAGRAGDGVMLERVIMTMLVVSVFSRVPVYVPA